MAAVLVILIGAGYSAYTISQCQTAILSYQAQLVALNAQLVELEARADPEESYYRGMFDVWQWIGKTTSQPVDSMSFVEKAAEKGWYDQPSAGWRWPISD